MWRGLDESSIEEIYFFLYHSLNSNPYLMPSSYTAEAVRLDIVDYLKKCGTLVSLSEYIAMQKPQEEKCFSLFGDTMLSSLNSNLSKQSFLFSVTTSKFKFPILIKLAKSDEHFYFSACSFDGNELTEFSQEIVEKFKYLPDYKDKTMFGIMYQEGQRLTIREVPLSDNYVNNLDLDLHYGDGFKQHHELVMQKLNTNKHGIFIFNGSAGTGKTTYIKYLAKVFGGKRMFVFIPTTHLESLISPSLIPILLDHKDSILVLEDAEKAIVSRESMMGNESLVSSLLNIGDGILGSMLNLSVILTFNTQKEKIDTALLRKGRLLYEHEFKNLSVPNSERLLAKLNKKFKVNEPMSLADIYNVDTDTGHKEIETARMGFAP